MSPDSNYWRRRLVRICADAARGDGTGLVRVLLAREERELAAVRGSSREGRLSNRSPVLRQPPGSGTAVSASSRHSTGSPASNHEVANYPLTRYQTPVPVIGVASIWVE